MAGQTDAKAESLADILPRIETVTFDCYGTLIDWRAGLQESFRRMFGTACEPRMDELFAAYLETEAEIESGPYQPYRSVLTQTAERLAERFGLALRPDAAGLPDLLPEWKPFTDTNEALRRLKKKYRLGLLSNIDGDLLAATCRHFPVTFDFTITAEDVRSYKPAAGHFEALLRRHSQPETILHVAQSRFHDGQACRRHGLAFVWINRYNDPADSAAAEVAEFDNLESFTAAV